MPYLSGAPLFDPWIADIKANKPTPTWWPDDSIFAHVDVAPGRVILLAGPRRR